MIRHIFSVHEESLFDCTVRGCDKKFKFLVEIPEHVKNVHPQLPPFKCNVCTNEYSSKAKLNYHMNVHLKPFVCEQCEKKFATKYSMEKHVKSYHKKIRPFKCDQCQKQFFLKGTLKGHVECVHEKKLKFACPNCPRRFYRKFFLERHITNCDFDDVKENIPENLEIPNFDDFFDDYELEHLEFNFETTCNFCGSSFIYNQDNCYPSSCDACWEDINSLH